VTAEELSRKVRGLELRARKMTGGLISGAYHSAFKGRGIEFLDVREYVPGDDTRTIDWNVTARAGHPFVKRYAEERDETVMLLVDGSLSMRFGSGDSSTSGDTAKSDAKCDAKWEAKWNTTAEIFAILASAAVQNHDHTGLILFSKEVDVYVPPACNGMHLLRMIREALAYQPREGGTDIGRALEFLGRVRRRRSLAFLISDFLGRGFDKPLRAQAKHHDLIAVPIFDARESQLPDCGLMDFEDAETGEIWTVDTSDEQVRGAHEREAWRRSEWLARLFRSAGVDALRIAAGSDYLSSLIAFLRLHAKKAA
jgi:uncharacterized protein (DUF58 family)